MKFSHFTLAISLCILLNNGMAAQIFNKNGNKLDLYGKVDTLHMFSYNGNIDGDQSYMRFGFKGNTQVNDLLSGYGQWEQQINANQAESGTNTSVTRLAYSGLKFGKYGSIDYGRNFGVLYEVGAWTDVIPEFGGDAYGIDNFMFKRTTGLLTYHNNGFFGLADGLKLAFQYQGKNGGPGETNNGRGVLQQNGDGYGMSLIYDWGDGLSVGATLASSDRTRGQNSIAYGRGNRAEAYRGGIKYDANQIYLSATYTQTYNATPFGSTSLAAYGFANQAHVTELIAEYQFLSGLAPIVGYLQTDGKDIEGYGDQEILKYIALGGAYYMNKNMSADIIYKINLLKNNSFTENSGTNVDNVLAVALIYYF